MRCLCLVNPGDEVIIPTPYWVSYSEVVKLAEGISVFIDAPVAQDFKITPAQLEAAITRKNQAVYVFISVQPNRECLQQKRTGGTGQSI